MTETERFHRQRFKPWERFHMDWLHEQERRIVLVIADAGSGWLEVFTCTNRSARNAVRYLHTINSRLGKPFKVVSDNEEEIISKNKKKVVDSTKCYKSDTPLKSPRSNGFLHLVQTSKCSLNFFNKRIGCSVGNNFDTFLFIHRNFSNARGCTPAKMLLGRSLWNSIRELYDVDQKMMYQPTVNH